MLRALLVIEISVTSRAVDLGRKAAIYAAAGIPEYWVLDLAELELSMRHARRSGAGERGHRTADRAR